MSNPRLAIEKLSAISLRDGNKPVLRRVSLTVGTGEVHGLVGESGAASTHQPSCTIWRPSEIMPPQVGVSEETDRPTKERMASTMTAMPISKLTRAIRTGATFGRISLNRIFAREKPIVRAAVT